MVPRPATRGTAETGRDEKPGHDPTPGHPRDRYRLVAKQVYCHGFAGASADAPQPFWECVDLWVARTYDTSRVPVVVIGGDGAAWLDTGLAHFPQAVRQRDGFHLGRDAARGWGATSGAALYEAVRAGDQATTADLVALPALPPVPAMKGTQLALPAPREAALLLPPTPSATPSADTRHTPRMTRWSSAQVARARGTFTSQVGTPDAAVDWRLQVAPELVPPDARGLGTQEGTNANLLARRMKKKGMAWSAAGARHLAKVREVVSTGATGGHAAVAARCHRPAPPPVLPLPHGRAAPGPLPWPQVLCPAARGPLTDTTATLLHRIDTVDRHRDRLP